MNSPLHCHSFMSCAVLSIICNNEWAVRCSRGSCRNRREARDHDRAGEVCSGQCGIDGDLHSSSTRVNVIRTHSDTGVL